MKKLSKVYAIDATFKHDAVYIKVAKGPSCMGCHFFGKGCDDPHGMKCTNEHRRAMSVKYVKVTEEEHDANQFKDLLYEHRKLL